MGKLYKNIGGPHYRRGDRDPSSGKRRKGTLIRGGQVFEPTPSELRAFPEKFVPVGGSAEVSKPAPKPKKEKEQTKQENAAKEVDVSQFHTGGGYYEIPGVGKVRGKAAALEALKNAGQD